MTAAADTPAPISRIYDLADLSEAGYEARIVPDAKDRARLAEWVEVEAIDANSKAWSNCAARGGIAFSYEAHLEADIVQSCVVTLGTRAFAYLAQFHRVLHLMPGVHRFADKGGAVTLDAGDDDAPEEIARSRYDLAGPLLEEFVLAIDPYPRAPGVAFEGPAAESDKPESPFAVLKQLKGQG
jgi:hypothetical protein